MDQPLIISTPDPSRTKIHNPEVMGGAGVLLLPVGTEVSLIHFPVPEEAPEPCGRTFPHLRHDTTAGECPGLDAEQVAEAVAGADDPWAIPVPYAVLESGLRVLEDSAGGLCERVVDGRLGECFTRGFSADSPYGATRACVPCIANRVLEGLPLPSGNPEATQEEENTHRAVIEGVVPPETVLIAAGTEDFCRAYLRRWLENHPLEEGQRALVLAVV